MPVPAEPPPGAADVWSAPEAAPADDATAPADAEAASGGEEADAADDGATRAPAALEDPAVLEASCRKGDVAACLRGADLWAAGVAGGGADEARARTLWGRACERRHPEGCRLQAESLLAGDEGSGDGRRGVRLLDRACELGSLVACAGLAERYLRGDGVRPDVYQSLLRFQRACNGGYAGACVAMQAARGLAETFDLPLPRPRDPPVPERVPAAETVCPPLFRRAAASGGGRLDRGLRGLSVAALAAVFPASATRGWSCAAGAAREPAAGAGAPVVEGSCRGPQGLTVGIAVRDRYLECTLQPGTGAAMLAAAAPGGGERTSLRVGAVDAVLIDPGGSPRLELWLADRCELIVTGGDGAPADDLRTVAAGFIGPSALGGICALREGEGLVAE
ncbi:MAG: sel1 repeat family protein [Deltaproteobacteria bacterium]|nr:sel1 repeat family protein [Deltaproteobacteria bacterium]